MNLFRSRVDVFEAINRSEWQKVKDAVVPGKANVRDQQYDATLLHWAVNEGHVPTVEHLLKCGADVRLRDGKHSATPLHWAAAKGHVFVVRLLMMQESDVNSRDTSNRTPLHWAAGNGQLGVIRELLFWGARVECKDTWRKVPLHWAAFRGHVASVDELVGKGSPIDQRDNEGHAPGDSFHQSVPEETRNAILVAMKRGPASGDSVIRAATDSSELLLETLHGCRSWGELFENRHFDVLSKECQEHRERLRGVIQGLADQGKPERLDPCLKAMDLLNSALSLHEDMRSGIKPVPLPGSGKGGGGGGNDRKYSSGSGPPRAGGGDRRNSDDLRDFLSPGEEGREGSGEAGPPGGTDEGRGGGGQGGGASSAASLRLYQLPAVQEACGGFDPKRCIGEGGFGKVYRGSMMGLPVAVKKLDETGLQGREQFFREVEVLSTCRHENIVPLLGVCMEPPCLVYRLMPNNSLRHHLDDPALRQRLGWRLRVRMTLHMCSGLEYLHCESPNKPKVVHGDIKPENILLDEYLKARLSDFGISRVGESEAGVARPRANVRGMLGSGMEEAAALQGTFGYMDPVYQSTGRLDESSDVFSLGVVMLELLTGDPVHCPDKHPPGLVDRVRKSLEDRALKSVVDRSAVWNKTAAKAYARLAMGCTAENPRARPALHDVREKIQGVLEAGQKSSVGTAAGQMGGMPAGQLVGAEVPAASIHHGMGDDLLQLFDDVNSSSKELGRTNGGEAGSIGGDAGSSSSNNMRAQLHPPPPYDEAIKSLSPRPPPLPARPPLYREAAPVPSPGVENLLVSLEDEGREGGAASSAAPDAAPFEELVDLGAADGEVGEAEGERWWGGEAGSARAQQVSQAPSNAGSMSALGSHRRPPSHPRSQALHTSGGAGLGGSKNASISCTRSTSLAEYGVALPGVLEAARGGGVLSSNPRLLCVCFADGSSDAATRGATQETGTAVGAGSSTLPPVGGGTADAVVREPGHVSVLDLWHRGRTVRYPVAAGRAAMSPNQSESVIAVLGGGSLHVFSIPRRCRLQEQAVATDLCMWRWLSPWGLALVTDEAVFYWSVSDSQGGSHSPDHDFRRDSSGGDRDSVGEANDRDAAARLRRPRPAFARRRTLTRPGTLHRVYDYQASADGRWGMLLCAVVDDDWGGGGNGYGYGNHSSGIEGGGGPVKVDLHSFELKTTFEFEVLGAALLTMPGSNPPLNLLGLVVRGDAGATEFRVLDLDRSLARAEGPEALERLVTEGEGWLIAATHVIADGDLRGSSACRVVTADGEMGGTESPASTSLVSPPVFLRQWTENSNVLFLVGCHGLLLLLDVVTGAELARAWACLPPVVEAEVDPDVGDLVVVSTAEGGGVHRLTVRAAVLRDRVEYDHKDAEMAERVSAQTGYGTGRPLLPPRRG